MKKALFLLIFVAVSLGMAAQTLVYTPELKNPANNATNQMPDVVVSWYAVAGSLNLQYQLQVDTSMNFNSSQLVDVTQTLITGYQMSNLLFNTKYYWRVRAIDGTTSPWSEIWNFTVFNTVDLLTPTNNKSDQESNVELTWKSRKGLIDISGVSSFDYQVDTSVTFNSPLLVAGSTNGTTFSYKNSNLRFDTRYFWRVKPRNPTSTGDWQLIWQDRSVTSEKAILGVYFVNESTGYLVGEEGTFFSTSDGGSTWTLMPTGTNKNLNGIFFLDASKGYVVGDAGLIMKTLNKGVSWTIWESGTSENLNGLYFTAERKGYVVGDNGTVLRTQNDTLWLVHNSGTTQNLKDIFFPTPILGYAVGTGGVIIKNVNNQIDWSPCITGTTKNLQDVFFRSDTFGFAVGTAGTVLKIGTDGTEWNSLSGFPNTDFTSITFPSSETGFICGGNGSLLKTFNSGKNWTIVNLEENTNLVAVSFSSDNNGYVFGIQGLVKKTTLGGVPYCFTTLVRPVLASPSNNSVNQVLDAPLKWKVVGGILSYGYEISSDENFTSLVFSGETDLLETNCEFLMFGNDYWWRVRARHQYDTTAWSESRKFTTINTVLLKSPSNDQLNVSLTPTMMWTAQTGIVGFQLQIAKDMGFTDIFYNVYPTMEASDTKVTRKMANGTVYYWRMRAFSDGGSLADTTDWSDPWKFTTTTPAGIEDQNATSLTIYPNPASGKAFIKVNSKEITDASFVVIDLLGKTVLNQSFNLNIGENLQELNLETLRKGIYVVRLTVNGATLNQKLVVD